MSVLNTMHIGSKVKDQLQHDWDAEQDAIKAYNDAIRLAVDERDNGSRALLESILQDEEKHIDWLEAHLDQIRQMGEGVYLVEQTD